MLDNYKNRLAQLSGLTEYKHEISKIKYLKEIDELGLFPNRFQIRYLTSKDVKPLQVIAIETFDSTFGKDNTPEDMKLYNEEVYSIEALLETLENPNCITLGIFDKEDLIAFMLVERLDKELEIRRIYVLDKYQGLKLGYALMLHAFVICKAYEIPTIILGVWEHNCKAQKFYQRNGFMEYSSHVFKLGTDDQTDLLMKKNIE